MCGIILQKSWWSFIFQLLDFSFSDPEYLWGKLRFVFSCNSESCKTPCYCNIFLSSCPIILFCIHAVIVDSCLYCKGLWKYIQGSPVPISRSSLVITKYHCLVVQELAVLHFQVLPCCSQHTDLTHIFVKRNNHRSLMKISMTGAGRKQVRIFTYRTVERCRGRLSS